MVLKLSQKSKKSIIHTFCSIFDCLTHSRLSQCQPDSCATFTTCSPLSPYKPPCHLSTSAHLHASSHFLIGLAVYTYTGPFPFLFHQIVFAAFWTSLPDLSFCLFLTSSRAFTFTCPVSRGVLLGLNPSLPISFQREETAKLIN